MRLQGFPGLEALKPNNDAARSLRLRVSLSGCLLLFDKLVAPISHSEGVLRLTA